jgi:hypothetical protein
MAYPKTTWKDRVVQKPLTYTLQNNGDGTTTLIPAEGTIVEPGTAITAAIMNKLETQYDESVNYFNAAPTWTNLTLQNGVQEFTAGTPSQYTRIGKLVIVQLVLKNVLALPTVVATLPSGYRPSRTIAFAAPTTGTAFARWTINTNGEITVENTSTGTTAAVNWYPLTVSFIAQ